MLRFFRTIRKNLIPANNRFVRYVLYALGEIILVVIGILIALQVNVWNEGRKLARQEEVILLQLADDIDRSLQDIQGNMKAHYRSIQAAETILEHMDSTAPFVDSLSFTLALSFLSTNFEISTGGYETLKSKGIDLIRDIDTRNAIIDLMEGTLHYHRQIEQNLIAYSERIRQELGSDYFSSYALSGTLPNLQGTAIPIDYESLRKNEKFRYHLTSYMEFNKYFQENVNGRMENELFVLGEMINHQLTGE